MKKYTKDDLIRDLLGIGGWIAFALLCSKISKDMGAPIDGGLGLFPPHPHHPPPPPPPPAPSYFPQYGPWMGYGSPPIILQLPSDMTLPGPEDFGIDGIVRKKPAKKKKKTKKEEEDED